MGSEELIRAWKDPEFRAAIGHVEHPAGAIALDQPRGAADTSIWPPVTLSDCTPSGTCDYGCYPTLQSTWPCCA